jgi:hypothetical protein
MLIPHLPSIVCAVTKTHDARRPVQQAAPPATNKMMSDSGDLVARALAILAEETETWEACRMAHLSSEITR